MISNFIITIKKSYKNLDNKATDLLNNFPYRSAFLLGSIGALAFPPIYFIFLLIPAFCGLLRLLQKTNNIKAAFKIGYVFGLGYFIVGLYWISISCKTIGLWYLMPLVLIGMPIYLSFFPALVCAITFLWQKNFLSQIFFFSSLWSLSEWLRGHILTGFPWNLLGYVWDLPLLQSTAWIGIYGVSFLTVFMSVVWMSRSKILINSSLILFISLWGVGKYRLSFSLTHPVTNTNMRIVQASIPQQEKWSLGQIKNHLKLYLTLSNLEAEKPLDAIIWPEAAITFFIEQAEEAQKFIKDSLPLDIFLLTGAPSKDFSDPQQIFSSLIVFNPKENVFKKVYDKHHLVPFGEYVPFKKWLPINKLTHGVTDYSKGKGLKTINLNKIPPFSPLICYEIIFPGHVVNPFERPKWLLSITNDAWYGHSSGPYQHLAIAQVRAIEEGIPLVRSANNGISCVVDPYGRILDQLELDKIGFIDFALPAVLPSMTFYSQWKEIPFIGFILISLVFGFKIRRRVQHAG